LVQRFRMGHGDLLCLGALSGISFRRCCVLHVTSL